MMMRNHENGPICVVEGKSDYGALVEHLDEPVVKLIVANGRQNVQGAMQIVAISELAGVFAVIDSDLDAFRGVVNEIPAVFYSEMHDLEADIFLLPRIADRIIHNYADSDRLKSHLGELGAIRPSKHVVQMASVLGLVRYISVANRIGLNLSEIPYNKVLSKDKLSLDYKSLARIILGKSKKCTINYDQILNLITICDEFDHISEVLCRGHDLCGLTAACLRSWWGANVPTDTIERTLRSALNCGELLKLNVRAQVAEWAEAAGHKVWDCDAA
ncbi:hypothetical protein [Amycolatopsis sp.]|uniref:hypothetical protein n=1 Tax=Amycolatopsis sp. TaxID=37632 RepID=UPI002B8628C8|nr:hypothetical protein [Amycolatopsis sp.]HVV09183.1 hypothetical protein [Amycolatopsis sp.]